MNDVVEQLARRAGLTASVVWVLVALALLLIAGSVVRLIQLFRSGAAPEERRKRLGSLAVWWALFGLLLVVAIAGMIGAVAVFAAGSWLGLREFRALAKDRIATIRPWWRLAYIAAP